MLDLDITSLAFHTFFHLSDTQNNGAREWRKGGIRREIDREETNQESASPKAVSSRGITHPEIFFFSIALALMRVTLSRKTFAMMIGS